MNNLDTNNSMADFMRLSNLKNLVGSRLRGRADKEYADMQNPEMDGAAMPPPMPPYMPEQPAPGNFDVRANLKIEPPPIQQAPAAQDGGMWSKISNGLKTIGAGRMPEQESELDNQAAAQSIEAPRGQQPVRDQTLGAGFDPTALLGAFGPAINKLLNPMQGAEEHARQIQSTVKPPDVPAQQLITQQPQMQPPVPAVPEPENETREPGSYTQPGAVSAAMENPTTKSEIERIFNTSLDPATTKIAEDYALAMSNYGKSLDELGGTIDQNVADIKSRIESRNLSTQDKLFMALALIAPAIMGGVIGGKEGLVGALGGGAKGIADVLQGNIKETKEDQQSLQKLGMDKASIGKERLGSQQKSAEFQKALKDSIPNKGLRDLVNAHGTVDEKGNLLIETGNPLLRLRSTKIREPDDYKRFKEKEQPDLEKKIGQVQTSINLIDEMNLLLDAAQQIENTGVSGWARTYIPLYDPAAKAIKNYIPFAKDTLVDENGNKINIAELFSSYREGLMDAQRQFFGGGKNSEHYQEHFFRELPDPFASKAFLEGKANLPQTKKQIEIMKNRLETSIINELEAKGVDTSAMKSLFGSSKTNKAKSETQRKKDRANAAADQVIRGK